MVFEGNFIEEMTQQMVAALSFALEADAEVEISEPKQVRKVLSTVTYAFSGEFAAGELFGSFYGQYSQKDNTVTLTQMKLKFGDMDAESVVKCASNQALLQGLSNAYSIYLTRKSAQPRIYPELVKKLDQIKEILAGNPALEKVSPIIADIKDMFGTDIELVDKLPTEKEY